LIFSLPCLEDDLAAKIRDIIATGSTPLLSKLRKRIPPALTELLHIPGLGPKRVKTLYHELDIHTIEQLQRAALDGRIRSLPGFGLKAEQHILQTLKAQTGMAKRFPLALAAQYAESLVAYLKQVPGVKQVVIAGSYQRTKETGGDIDILITTQPTSMVATTWKQWHELRVSMGAREKKRGLRGRGGLRLFADLELDRLCQVGDFRAQEP
jgi:DNA polymerase (family 10)